MYSFLLLKSLNDLFFFVDSLHLKLVINYYNIYLINYLNLKVENSTLNFDFRAH